MWTLICTTEMPLSTTCTCTHPIFNRASKDFFSGSPTLPSVSCQAGFSLDGCLKELLQTVSHRWEEQSTLTCSPNSTTIWSQTTMRICQIDLDATQPPSTRTGWDRTCLQRRKTPLSSKWRNTCELNDHRLDYRDDHALDFILLSWHSEHYFRQWCTRWKKWYLVLTCLSYNSNLFHI